MSAPRRRIDPTAEDRLAGTEVTEKELRAFWRDTTKMIGAAEERVFAQAWERYKALRPNGSAQAFCNRFHDIWHRRIETSAAR